MAKKTLLTCTLLLGLSPLVTSCVMTQDHQTLQLKVRNQNNRIVEMEHKLNDLATGGGDSTAALQRQQADLATNIDRLKTQFLQIQGQLEEATYRNRILLDKNQSFQKQFEIQMASLIEQDKATQKMLQTTSNQVSSITDSLEQNAQQKKNEAARKETLAKQKAENAEKARQKAKADLLASQEDPSVIELKPRMEKNKPTDKQVVDSPPPVVSKKETTVIGPRTSAGKLYDKGLGEYRAKNFNGAIESFSQFLEQHKDHQLLPNAKYWLGASRLKNGDYSGAVLEFQHIVADYPKHPKAPEALLKQAEAFGHFGDKMVQTKLYNDVINYYPQSEQAKTAKLKLGKL